MKSTICKSILYVAHRLIFHYFLQGVITQLSEQISTLNERMDEFTSQIEELGSKLSTKKLPMSQQNLPLQAEACNGSVPTSLFVSNLGNGTLLPTSSSSNQLIKESPVMEEVSKNLATFLTVPLFQLFGCFYLICYVSSLIFFYFSVKT